MSTQRTSRYEMGYPTIAALKAWQPGNSEFRLSTADTKAQRSQVGKTEFPARAPASRLSRSLSRTLWSAFWRAFVGAGRAGDVRVGDGRVGGAGRVGDGRVGDGRAGDGQVGEWIEWRDVAARAKRWC
ncbi:hypothetical protein K504DRAFT_11933 [Pleomassaria siparia CBS 279.74]|uniref:Uncharacterized protein n=1 Tax=Pleomassaria siparia CBS 279.74 TaxID=1314801 RepID=A0A6G1KQK2_9PLEO|nr:hypothetical protein K504DRAFT_11933 [Pleomassaria siparia CBS 279.74]